MSSARRVVTFYTGDVGTRGNNFPGGGLTEARSALSLRTCSHELDSLGRPTRREGHSQRARRTVPATLRGVLNTIKRSYAQWQSSRRKQSEGRGFDPLRTRHLTHYCVIRQDLPLGVLGAQLVHAAGESAPKGGVPNGTYAVALAAKSERHLASLEEELRRISIPHVGIREPDRNDELMAIGIYPVEDRRLLRRVLGNLPLLGKESK